MIEKMFPQTVSNIIDYDAIKAAAKKYVEDVFVEIVKSFGDNLILQTMDEAHLSEVSKHVAGDSGLSVEELLSYMNTENIYRESEFVSDLLTAFPSGVEYLEFEVTGWKFPQVDFIPFNDPERSYNYDGTPSSGAGDDVWMDNAFEGYYVNNLLMSRYKGQFGPNSELDWHKKSGRRSSWGDAETWMTTGGFGKPASIHINVDEERTVLEENGLSSVENWLGTVANKLPINLYIEINDIFKTNGEDTAGSTNGYRQSFPYAEGEGFCTNDPAMAVSPDVATVTYTVSYANTQLPDVQIELPESETVEDGYSIILPTMTGEYESGGKTWKPSAWDIGAFGSSYSLTADTVAHLVFTEVQQYQEITLYMASGDKRAQGNISSDESHTMTSTANSSYMYDLFYDPELTQHFRYDYSNDYEIGSYNSETGEWKPWAIQSIYSMPDTTSSDATLWKIGYILYDLGKLWLVSNVVGGGYMQTTIESFKVRIYPKDQQYYAGYFNTYDSYNNKTISGTSSLSCYSAPNTTSRFAKPNGFPEITLRKILTSSTMERNLSDFAEVGTTTIDVKHLVGGSADSRLAVFTLDQPTLYSWINLTGNTTCSSGTVRPLLDADGNYVLVDPAYDYVAIGLIQYNGQFITGMLGYLNYSVMGALDNSHPERLCWSQTYDQATLSCVWYYKKPKS